jgi:enamine deaminase RidA (YjgF/YER057c/UK114 family)
MEKRAINPTPWSEQLGFSQMVEVRNAERVLYCAGQTAVDANGKTMCAGDMLGQFTQALNNLQLFLREAGMDLENVVRLNYYVTDIPAFHEANESVRGRLKAAGCLPSSTLLKVAGLADPEMLIEIEATAVG